MQTTLDGKTPRGYISKYYRFKVLKRQNWKCKQCGVKLKYSSKQDFDASVAHIDHVIPLSKGGEDDIENFQALCPECNLKKSATMPSSVKSGGMSQLDLFNEIQGIDIYLMSAKKRMTEHNKGMIQHLADTKDKLLLYTTVKGRV